MADALLPKIGEGGKFPAIMPAPLRISGFPRRSHRLPFIRHWNPANFSHDVLDLLCKNKIDELVSCLRHGRVPVDQ